MAARVRTWCLTLNNPTEEEEQALLSSLHGPSVVRAVVAREVGESGTPHLQGYVQLKSGKTMTAFKRWAGCERYHLEEAIAGLRAWNYCLKGEQSKEEWEKQHEDGPNWGRNLDLLTRVGDAPTADPHDSWGQALQMLENGQTVLDVLRRFPGFVRNIGALERTAYALDAAEEGAWRDLTVTYLSGPSGCGKTRLVMEKHGYGEVYRVRKGGNPWDGYTGQDVVLFDEFRNDFRAADMLEWLDGYPVSLPARYTDKAARFTTVYIVSNWHLHEQYRNLQDGDRETWLALLRRIHTVQHMEADGTLHDLCKPE